VALSLLAGITFGLVITWVILPVEIKNADLSDSRLTLKEDYVRMTSMAYETTANRDAAQKRIQALGLNNPSQTLDDLITREKNSSNTASRDALIHLSQALGMKLPYKAERPAPGAPATVAVCVIATPEPPVLTFRLIEHTPLNCASQPDPAHLEIFVRDTAGNGLPNIAIEVRSGEVNETIYTGLKPEHGVGYADYETTPGTYAVRILGAESETISDLVIGAAPVDCKIDRGATPRGWKLVFQQK